MQDRRWDRINGIGFWIEAALARLTAVVLLVVFLVLVLRTEWALLPEAAQEEVVCSEALSALAARSFTHLDPRPPGPPENQSEWLDHCEALAASTQHGEATPTSTHAGWWLPLSLPDVSPDDP